ncbi:unnamed protein product [Microthlaspi erraticum]|uniref:RNase H type-1 domain-containing protein n=1 Tax=Microthlaspi erraticum TaxID=1685480 RepID=A0A6D2KZD1_9BRAS|nr:unnamed protein product [Microthlaspi erraticum]
MNRGILDSACCVYCGDLETTEHLFFRCAFAREVWNLAPFSTPIDPLQLQSFAATLTISKDWVCLPPTGTGSGPLFAWICWAIWKSRNTFLFEERLFSPAETISKATKEAREWQQAQFSVPKPQQGNTQSGRRQNKPNTITCFSDGAWSADNWTGGMGWLFVDESGKTLTTGSSAEASIASPLVAEAISIRSALNHALDIGITDLHLKTDAQDLVRALTMQEQIKEIYGILFDIQTLAFLFESISFSFVPRSENTFADSIAKNARISLANLILAQGPHV